MKDDLVTRRLDVNLTAEETAAYSQTLAAEVENHNTLVREAKNIAAACKKNINEKKEEVDDLATKVRNQKEPRDVSCKWDFDFNANTKRLIRQDTFELVETRVIEASERQAYLQLTEEANAEEVTTDGQEAV